MSLRTSLPALALVRPIAAATAKQHVKFRAEASAEPSVFELDVYDIVDPIGENMWWGTTFVSAKDVRAKLKAAGDVSRIIVRINSVGGDVFDGTAIYNLLKDHPARVEVHVDGICASIASIIAMAGDDITMGQGTWMMIHEPYSQMMLDARSDDLRKAADTLDKMCAGLCAVYAERTGIDEKECLALMQEETWMTAEEALEKGFCTAINSVPLQTNPGDEPEVTEQVEAMVAELTRTYSRIPAGALQAMNIATHSYAIAASAAAAARPRAEEDADDKKKMKSLEEDKQALQDEVTELKKQLKAAEEEADKAKKAKAADDEEDKKAKAEFPPKKDDDDEEDSSSGDDKDGKKAEAQALAMLALDVRNLTGAKNLTEARKALAQMVAKQDRSELVETEMVAMAKERHIARVSDCIAKGMVRPARKDYMLGGLDEAKTIAEVKAVSAKLDDFLAGSGGEVIGPPLNQELRQPTVKQLADASGKGIVTAEDREIGKHLNLSEAEMQAAADLRAQRFGAKASA